jgi:hypothetical protein
MKTDPIWTALEEVSAEHGGFFEASAYVDLFFGWKGSHHTIRVSFYRDGAMVKSFSYRTTIKEINEDFVIRQVRHASLKMEEYLKSDDSWQAEELGRRLKEQ